MSLSMQYSAASPHSGLTLDKAPFAPGNAIATALYGVIGQPIAHSRSPALFNQLFRELGMNAVYLGFAHADVGALMTAMRTLNIRGYSITLPHKQTAVACVDELDASAKPLGAINTAVNVGGVLTGYNFDGLAAVAALQAALPKWYEREVVIVGAGGSAAGIAHTLVRTRQFKQRLSIAARNPGRSAALVAELQKTGANVQSMELAQLQTAERTIPPALPQKVIVIQTTPLGMSNISVDSRMALPLAVEQLPMDAFVYDIIYTPLQTPLLQAAAARGLQTLNGLMMFVEQAALQFKVFTGHQLGIKAKTQLRTFLQTELSSA